MGRQQFAKLYSVLFPIEVSKAVQTYLFKIVLILTKKKDAFSENPATPQKITLLLENIAKLTSAISPTISLVAGIGGAIIPSTLKILEKNRNKSEIEARSILEKNLREEFGVWISESGSSLKQNKLSF